MSQVPGFISYSTTSPTRTAVTLAWMIAFESRYYVFAGQGLPEIEAFFLKLIQVVVTTFLNFYNVNHLNQDITRKEIARLLDISYQTVEKHSGNIRKQIGLAGRKINLLSYLQNDCFYIRSHLAKLMSISYPKCYPLKTRIKM